MRHSTHFKPRLGPQHTNHQQALDGTLHCSLHITLEATSRMSNHHWRKQVKSIIAFGAELEITLGTTPESVGVLLISRSVHASDTQRRRPGLVGSGCGPCGRMKTSAESHTEARLGMMTSPERVPKPHRSRPSGEESRGKRDASRRGSGWGWSQSGPGRHHNKSGRRLERKEHHGMARCAYHLLVQANFLVCKIDPVGYRFNRSSAKVLYIREAWHACLPRASQLW